jgi:hypothetical protein
MKEFITTIAVQSKHSKVPTDFRFEKTKVMIDLSKVIYFREYYHPGTEKFMDTHVEVVVFGQSVPLYLEMSYKEFKKEMENHFNPNAL